MPSPCNYFIRSLTQWLAHVCRPETVRSLMSVVVFYGWVGCALKKIMDSVWMKGMVYFSVINYFRMAEVFKAFSSYRELPRCSRLCSYREWPN